MDNIEKRTLKEMFENAAQCVPNPEKVQQLVDAAEHGDKYGGGIEKLEKEIDKSKEW